MPCVIFVVFLLSLSLCACSPFQRLRTPGEPTARADTMTAAQVSTISIMDIRRTSTPTGSVPMHLHRPRCSRPPPPRPSPQSALPVSLTRPLCFRLSSVQSVCPSLACASSAKSIRRNGLMGGKHRLLVGYVTIISGIAIIVNTFFKNNLTLPTFYAILSARR